MSPTAVQCPLRVCRPGQHVSLFLRTSCISGTDPKYHLKVAFTSATMSVIDPSLAVPTHNSSHPQPLHLPLLCSLLLLLLAKPPPSVITFSSHPPTLPLSWLSLIAVGPNICFYPQKSDGAWSWIFLSPPLSLSSLFCLLYCCKSQLVSPKVLGCSSPLVPCVISPLCPSPYYPTLSPTSLYPSFILPNPIHANFLPLTHTPICEISN